MSSDDEREKLEQAMQAEREAAAARVAEAQCATEQQAASAREALRKMEDANAQLATRLAENDAEQRRVREEAAKAKERAEAETKVRRGVSHM